MNKKVAIWMHKARVKNNDKVHNDMRTGLLVQLAKGQKYGSLSFKLSLLK